MNDFAGKEADKIVSRLIDWQNYYNIVRVSQKDNGELVARKIAVVDGKEDDSGIDYEIETSDNQPLPKAGDYPSNLFDDLRIAASYCNSNGELEKSFSRDAIVYIGSKADL